MVSADELVTVNNFTACTWNRAVQGAEAIQAAALAKAAEEAKEVQATALAKAVEDTALMLVIARRAAAEVAQETQKALPSKEMAN